MLISFAFLLFTAITAVTFRFFNSTQADPYMDEIFHIPQAQNYCVGNLGHWNNKITTLPGLYVVSLIGLKVRRFMPFIGKEDEEDPCSVLFLRFGNLLFMLANLWLLYEISVVIKSNLQRKLQDERNKIAEQERNKKKKKSKIANTDRDRQISDESLFSNHSFLNALVLSSFPLLYFFAFLYYTDQGSTTMVLLMYLFSLQDSHITASLTGSIAVCFRQTNIIWVVFVAATSILRHIEDGIPEIGNGLPTFITGILQAVRSRIKIILQTAFGYLCVGIAFVIFIVKNNGIVVGDRSSHQACLHVPQMFYFIGFSVMFSFPLFLTKSSMEYLTFKAKELIACKKKLILTFVTIFLMAVIIAKLSFVHEYLLADNRHYTFYVWKKIFERHWLIKYLAIPCYLIGALMIKHLLEEQNSGIFILLFAACTSLVTVPQKLLEFRYFVVPYLLYRLHVKLPPYWCLAIEFLVYMVVNVFTIVMFLYKPFYWDNEQSIQRFMW
eukprot:Seg1275.3 transcript_id=Seg1275.3/GoldUCD/mRNA.D3Y31 product=Dol-P-Glc:Glc protein_id=Seg1275.3/GoldUCD/D3Y31